MGVFSLITEEPIDPALLRTRRFMCKGESSKSGSRKKQNFKKIGSMFPRLASPNLSNSIFDSNILNCNRRFGGY